MMVIKLQLLDVLETFASAYYKTSKISIPQGIFIKQRYIRSYFDWTVLFIRVLKSYSNLGWLVHVQTTYRHPGAWDFNEVSVVYLNFNYNVCTLSQRKAEKSFFFKKRKSFIIKRGETLSQIIGRQKCRYCCALKFWKRL